MEKHYSVQDVATTWGVDETTVRRLFIDEPGVLRLGTVRTTSRGRQRIARVYRARTLAR